jgi:type I restriction enzyme S subunit
MEVKHGYKQTEVGVIPEEWEVKPLAEIAEKIMVGIASAATHAYRVKGVPMFRNQNIKAGHLDDSDLLFIAPEYEATFKNKRLRGGDLLTMRTGYPGVTAIVPPRYDSAQSFTTLITRPKQEEANSDYLCHFINSELGQRFFTQSQIGGAQKNVNVAALRKMPIPLPKPPEQDAIAEALSDADELLGRLDRLIAKKRGLKQAAMQQLLTGQTRLPGFHSEWEETALRDLGQFLKGSGVTKDQTRSGNLACVRYGELYTHHSDVIRHFNSWISPDVALTAVRLRKGDILFAGSGETKEEIGKCAAFAADVEAYAGGDIVILRPHEADAVFLGYFLNTAAINRQKTSRGQGDAVVHISSSALGAIRCRIPKPAEQAAIAEVLTEMDLELAALERRREKTRALKQAMMQVLLTGKTRLI